MKKIAVTQRLIENSTYYEVREALDIRFAKLLSKAGFLALPLPYEVDFRLYFENVGIDGVVFTGGNDLYVCSNNELSLKRDTFEKKLLEYCIDNGIPVLGICRGMQIIAEYFGSTFKKAEGQVNVRHKLDVNPQSGYAEYLSRLQDVNSFHDFQIDVPGDGLIISAENGSGVIKAIEHGSHNIFAQMWHSERENPFKVEEIELIKRVLS